GWLSDCGRAIALSRGSQGQGQSEHGARPTSGRHFACGRGHAPAPRARRARRRRRPGVRRIRSPVVPRRGPVRGAERPRPREHRPALLVRRCARGDRGHFRTPPLMRVLLIAYEFLPSASPQSLRWGYLVRELSAAGHEVHVLTADAEQDAPGLPAIPDTIRVHRTFAGPIRGTLALHQKYRRRHPRKTRPGTGASAAPADAPLAAVAQRRSWKLRLVEIVQAVGAV